MSLLKMRKHKPKSSAIEYEPYENCPFCKHREKPGCFGCKERKTMDEKAAAKQAADLARMEASRLGTFRFDNPDEMATLQEVFSASALSAVFDSTAVSDEEVYASIGGGSAESGKTILMAQARMAWQFDSSPWQANPRPIQDYEKMALDLQRQKFTQSRAQELIKQALSGKPGSGPGANT